MTLSGFRATFPEFADTSDALILAALVDASADVEPTIWGADYDRAHGLRAADLLQVAPAGQASRLQSDKAETVYGKRFAQLQKKVGVGCGRCF